MQSLAPGTPAAQPRRGGSNLLGYVHSAHSCLSLAARDRYPANSQRLFTHLQRAVNPPRQELRRDPDGPPQPMEATFPRPGPRRFGQDAIAGDEGEGRQSSRELRALEPVSWRRSSSGPGSAGSHHRVTITAPLATSTHASLTLALPWLNCPVLLCRRLFL